MLPTADFVNSLAYPLLNLANTALFAISFIQSWNTASFVNNMIWGAISAYGVFGWVKTRMPAHIEFSWGHRHSTVP